MTLKPRTMAPPLGLLLALLLTACGNKGELFLVPDELTQQELINLEQTLQGGTPTTTVEDLLSEGVSDEEESTDEDSKKDKSQSTPAGQ